MENHVKMLRELICSVFGHKGLLLSRISTERSQFGHWICTRCKYTENYNYDR